ncbi:Heparan-alpha-glucosaminide N-acetyltransferase [Lamellibrachia satsuma]|nr:Heparan-alpha-glucosaminide N-acetyltransferase [Lamellibrachia satsuma]
MATNVVKLVRINWILLYLFVLASCTLTIVKLEDGYNMAETEEDISMSHREERKHGKHVIDTATVTLTSKIEFKTSLVAQSDVCWKCPLEHVTDIAAGVNKTVFIDTRFPQKLCIVTSDHLQSHEVCSVHSHLKEYGQYTLLLHRHGNTDNITCSFLLGNAPLDSDLPVYVALAFFAVVSLAWVIIRYLRRCYMLRRAEVVISNEHLVNTDLGSPSGLLSHPSSTPVILPRKRMRSLDAFRGLCIAVMVFVNYGGGHYWYFKHSAWNGLTVADLVFPWFTFIMGTSIALAFSSLLSRGITRRQLAVKVVKRSIILFVLGLMLSNNGRRGFVRMSELRILGVLQRLALSYCAVGLMQVFFARSRDVLQETRWPPVRDLAPYWPEWLISLAILAIHICLTLLMPVSGCPTGYLGPGGLHDNGDHWNCTGGAAGAIDRLILGKSHMYKTPTCTKIYHTTVAFDPEGILGTLTSIFLCFLGLQAGKIIIVYPEWKQRIKRWFIWMLITGLTAGVLCKFSQNDGWIPCNKNLW